jgi:hypothetical protein
MSTSKGNAVKWIKTGPKCVFCDLIAKPMIILQAQEYSIKGWRCPKCGFTLLDPKEIPKAMSLLKEARKIY